ncbi:insulin receptor substrate 2a [Denticeps clupeoides]|uniref:Insulin receptor substrate 2 n=1 Tax=Denticeps clupeoides TaxID=299321 RepID=A0AAY4C9H0_9TELE|nr:insulin receptor substrate 2 [Denticeps clupeoides]
MASPPATRGPSLCNVSGGGGGGVRKCGYLKKQKHGHRRFFVLREPADGQPAARLEYYESEKKWRNKCAAKRVIPLDACLSVNKRADAKHKHLVALYTKDEYFAVAADCEQEQESWYRVLAEATGDGPACASAASPAGSDDAAAYGPAAPAAASAAYREVWQVNLKSKGLGQSRNITGVYRLCLSSRTVSFVKLNSEVAAVTLQLMNIRRCGHSDSFFFIEVGRSASTGPGELWMQADDTVVAQNIHETILEAMKAMKELSEFRPRSKSQSASTNPISVPTRRNLNNLPPSQTGLVRRSRTDSMARSTSESSCLQHGRSMSMPVSQSPPSALSPLSAGGPSLTPVHRPSSCSGSVSGSPGSAGFLSYGEYSSSPGEARYNPAARSDTPSSSSLSGTPPSRGPSDLHGYMMMDRSSSQLLNKVLVCSRERLDAEKSYRKRTYSLTTPRQQRVPAQLSSASLDEYMLMRAAYGGHSGRNSHSASPKVSYPEDYGDVEIGSLRSSACNLGDGGYMPMTPGVAQQVPRGGDAGCDHYMPMSPMCVSAPKQIINPRTHPPATASGCASNSPSGSSLEDSGYMRMWSGSKSSLESADGRLASGEFMSPVDTCASPTPPDYFLGLLGCEAGQRPPSGLAARAGHRPEDDQYVLMSPRSQKVAEESNYYTMSASAASPSALGPHRPGRGEGLAHRGRANRPNRLYLDTLRTLPSMNEHPLPAEPKSPGEYINIDFGDAEPPAEAAESRPSSLSADYMNMDLRSGGGGAEDGGYFLNGEEAAATPGTGKDGYVEMVFSNDLASPDFVPGAEENGARSPSSIVQRLSVCDPIVPGMGAFLLPEAPSEPYQMAKVIRADPRGRRRHSSETFSSTTTVTPVFPSFARSAKRHSSASVENVSVRSSSEGSDEEYGSPMCRETSAGYQNGLNYIALNLMGNRDAGAPCTGLLSFKAVGGCCKGGINGLHAAPYACLGFKDTATAVKD